MKHIYIGSFVHSLSLKKLEIRADGAIGVDERGVIAFVERDGSRSIEAIHAREGWADATIHRLAGKGFYVPGFIGVYLLTATSIMAHPVFDIRDGSVHIRKLQRIALISSSSKTNH